MTKPISKFFLNLPMVSGLIDGFVCTWAVVQTIYRQKESSELLVRLENCYGYSDV